MEIKEQNQTAITPYNIANLVNISKYAALRKVTRQTVYNWIADKRITTVEILGKPYIDKNSLPEK